MEFGRRANHKDEAFKVIEYLAGESAQKTISNRGYTMCNQRELAMTEYVAYQENSGNPPQNIRVFAEVCDTYRPAIGGICPTAHGLTNGRTR